MGISVMEIPQKVLHKNPLDEGGMADIYGSGAESEI